MPPRGAMVAVRLIRLYAGPRRRRAAPRLTLPPRPRRRLPRGSRARLGARTRWWLVNRKRGRCLQRRSRALQRLAPLRGPPRLRGPASLRALLPTLPDLALPSPLSEPPSRTAPRPPTCRYASSRSRSCAGTLALWATLPSSATWTPPRSLREWARVRLHAARRCAASSPADHGAGELALSTDGQIRASFHAPRSAFRACLILFAVAVRRAIVVSLSLRCVARALGAPRARQHDSRVSIRTFAGSRGCTSQANGGSGCP